MLDSIFAQLSEKMKKIIRDAHRSDKEETLARRYRDGFQRNILNFMV